MENGVRRGFLIAGAVIGFLGFVTPGVYAVNFSPPEGSPFANAELDKLDGFHGLINAKNVVVYNGFAARSTCSRR